VVSRYSVPHTPRGVWASLLVVVGGGGHLVGDGDAAPSGLRRDGVRRVSDNLGFELVAKF
jgi:hypothetical protein